MSTRRIPLPLGSELSSIRWMQQVSFIAIYTQASCTFVFSPLFPFFLLGIMKNNAADVMAIH